MESNNYNLSNQNLKDINDENKDGEAPPSIIQSQIDINFQHSESSNSNTKKHQSRYGYRIEFRRKRKRKL